jgi:hypothetical protein
MAFLGISENPNAGLESIGANVGAIVDSVVGDLLDTITGDTKFKKLYSQAESDYKQYTEQPADIRQWHTIPTDQTEPNYYFLLRYKGTVLQINFNINPQRESITEPHGVTTVYTQGGGKIIQSEGMITKDINISGSCGLYPGERRTRLPDSGVGSGFEAFKMLQNVFRRYCFLRRFGDLTQGLQLIYINRRSQESWVVMPKVFVSEDATEHNFNPSYNITLETLYPYEGDDAKGLIERLLDSIPGWRQLDAVVQRLSETVDAVNAAAGQISAIVDSFGATILSRVVSLANSWADVKAGRLPNLSNFKRDSVKSIVYDLRSTAAALEASGADELAHTVIKLERAVGGTLLLDEQYDSNPTSKAGSVTRSQNAQVANYTDSQGRSVAPSDAIAAGNVTSRPDSSQAIGGSASAPASLPGSETALAEYKAAQGPETQTVTTIGGSTIEANTTFKIARSQAPDESAVAVPPSTAQISSQLNWDQSWDEALRNVDPANADYRTGSINVGDSIQSLTQRLIGDPARWVEIVLLNNLQYPYVADQAWITANGATNVLPYGGSILYPVPKAKSGSRTRVWRQETFVSLALSPFERTLGNDILIDENTGDVVWTANDLALTYGVDNYKQFMRKRVVTRRNSLRRSLRLGFSNLVGVSVGAFEAIVKAESRALFFDDERTVSSQAIKVVEQGGQLQLAIAAFVRDAQDPVILSEQDMG